jgi:hypothetical protein
MSEKNTVVFELRAYRESQYDSYKEASDCGGCYTIGEFSSHTELETLKRAAGNAVDMMDGNEKVVFQVSPFVAVRKRRGGL